jgi:hypothetical protein
MFLVEGGEKRRCNGGEDDTTHFDDGDKVGRRGIDLESASGSDQELLRRKIQCNLRLQATIVRLEPGGIESNGSVGVLQRARGATHFEKGERAVGEQRLVGGLQLQRFGEGDGGLLRLAFLHQVVAERFEVICCAHVCLSSLSSARE